MPEDNLRALAVLCRNNWTIGSQTIADLDGRQVYADATANMAEGYRTSTDGETTARLLEEHYASDVTEMLPHVRARTLVVHRRDDAIIPFAAGRKLAAGIPGSRLVQLPAGVHAPRLGDSDGVLEVLDGFLPAAEQATGQSSEMGALSAFRTILFTDLVAHTEMMRRLGDEKGRAVLREHEQLTREVLKAHGGAEVKTMGDGFMASFPSVTRAVECALALQQAFAERNAGAAEPLTVRVGLNAGEPIEEDGDLFGETVILAARIAAQAQGGEILASMAVRELCAGKGFLFADMGEHAMRGFEDPVRMFEIKRRE
jgi:class 3 adenylate cyclase